MAMAAISPGPRKAVYVTPPSACVEFAPISWLSPSPIAVRNMNGCRKPKNMLRCQTRL